MRASKARVLFMGIFLLGFLCLFEMRAFYLQALRRDGIVKKARRQYYCEISLPSKRGRIMDREGRVMALSLLVPSLYAVPREIPDKEGTSRLLSENLALDYEEVRRKLASGRPFVWIKRHATPEELQRVRKRGIRGVDAVEEPKRFYPFKEMAAPLLGFVGIDHVGLEGLEKAYDQWLKAPGVKVVMERDALGRFISLPLEEPVGGDGPWDLRLTIDLKVQYILERELERGLLQAKAKRAVGVIMDPFTGEVLAMASRPSFNPNAFEDYPRERWKNWATLGLFEPGSIMKPFLVGAALEERLLDRDDVFFCERGKYRAGPVTIRDVKAYNWLTVEEVLQYSSNIGAAKVAMALGPHDYHRYLKALGFGSATGVGIPEEEGNLRPPERWTTVDLMNLGFGQGMSCTPLQVAVAYSALANGGIKVRPLLVAERIRATDGRREVFRPQLQGRVFSQGTCRVLMEILEKAVEEGTGVKARIEGYRLAGKTGTSQKYDHEKGVYSRDRFVASFVGILPSDYPRAVVVLMFDEPQTSIYGGEVAAPVFREIARELLTYWNVPRVIPEVLLAEGR